MDANDIPREFLSKTIEFFHVVRESGAKAGIVFHGETVILKKLSMTDRCFLPGELSDMMHMSSARVAMTLKNLEHKGLIERNVNKKDRRKVLVTITERGREQVTKIEDEFAARMRQVTDELGEEDSGEYIRIVGRLIEISKKLSGN